MLASSAAGLNMQCVIYSSGLVEVSSGSTGSLLGFQQDKDPPRSLGLLAIATNYFPDICPGDQQSTLGSSLSVLGSGARKRFSVK